MQVFLYALTSNSNGGDKFPVWLIVAIAVIIVIIAIAQFARRTGG
jgi:hypothetical protein